MKFTPLFTYSKCYREIYRPFVGVGKEIYRAIFPTGKISPIDIEIFGVSIPGQILHGENFPEFMYKIRFICLTFS